VGILESNGNDLINDVGEGTIINVVTENGVENIELIPVREGKQFSRFAAYTVLSLNLQQRKAPQGPNAQRLIKFQLCPSAKMVSPGLYHGRKHPVRFL
jgi:hypothetical protein